jgi:hypothetical protein
LIRATTTGGNVRVTKSQLSVGEELLERHGEVDEYTVGAKVLEQAGDVEPGTMAPGDQARKIGTAVLLELTTNPTTRNAYRVTRIRVGTR